MGQAVTVANLSAHWHMLLFVSDRIAASGDVDPHNGRGSKSGAYSLVRGRMMARLVSRPLHLNHRSPTTGGANFL